MEDGIAELQERLLKVAEVAAKLSISRALAYRLIRDGLIASVRIGHAVRVKPSDLEAYVRRCHRANPGD